MGTEEPKRPCLYVFLNSGLNMSTGKAAAQAVHAATGSVLMSSTQLLNEWDKSPLRTVIVLEARDELHLQNIKAYLGDRGIATKSIIDEGVNEVDAHTYTALSCEILDRNDPNVVDVMGAFNKFRDKIKVVMEVNR